MTTMELTPRERAALRSAAHPLKPVVLIGDNGLTEAVLKEIDLNLSAHELIKVRAGTADRETRDAMLNTICDTLSCETVHHLGKMLILYRFGSKGTYLKTESTPASPKRKASEPHTPKKLAAEGKKLARPSRRARPEKDEQDADVARPKVFSSDRPTRPSLRVAKDKDSTHGIPRRSALSLKAGARRGALGSTIRKRAAIKK